MKNFLLLLFLSTTANFFAQKIDYNTKKGFIAEGYDVVAYFVDKKPIAGKKKFLTTYDGVKLKFSSAKNLTTFNENPTKYMPQYGGYCAYAIAAKKNKMYIDAEAYEIRNGKLYLFYTSWFSSALDVWKEGDTKKLQNQGDINWEVLKHRNK
ncbi:YHS domain-containing (seleno)protein [Tenacibaculum insulae]|uniref:YHS domain-containing (seleno)protein n=1 Tax=Tenacibaculum insulae TaxID=2029677 RepID=UPI003AB3943A